MQQSKIFSDFAACTAKPIETGDNVSINELKDIIDAIAKRRDAILRGRRPVKS